MGVINVNGLFISFPGNDVDMKDDAIKEGRLNTKDCLHSLALLRRAKWFQARANSLQNCVLTIRIMRDFCLRNPVWSSLDLWVKIELFSIGKIINFITLFSLIKGFGIDC